MTALRKEPVEVALPLEDTLVETDSNCVAITFNGLQARYVSHFVTVRDLASHRTVTGIRLMGANSVIKNCDAEHRN